MSASAVGSDASRKTRPPSSPQRSMLTVPGSIPTTRGMRSAARRGDLAGDVVDRLGVEHQVVAREQPRDAGLVQLHLEIADADGAEDAHAVALRPVVRR